MPLYRRRLPHIDAPDRSVFLTWRLHGSLPPHRAFPEESVNSGQAFEVMDRMLEEVRTGPFYLRQPAIADVVMDAIHYGAERLRHYHLIAFAVMPNHVHMLIRPLSSLAVLTKSLKGITAKRANQILGLTSTSFWQAESYDHSVRDAQELVEIRRYIEENPVRAGLVQEARQYRWSSAAEPLRAVTDRMPQ